MTCNTQCIPTPSQWIGRKHVDPTDGTNAYGAFVSVSYDYVLVERLTGLSESAGAVGGSAPTFANGDVNISQVPAPESAGAAAAAPTFSWDSTTVNALGQSESPGAIGQAPTFNWDFIIVNGAGQSESASALAQDPTFNNG